MLIDVRPGSSRFVTRTDSVQSRHSFSFGPHYDPGNVGFGLLAAHNDDVLQPGGGFSEHTHRGVDIVTWVVAGALRHHDDAGGSGVACPGTVQLLSAGPVVRHSEVNAFDGVTRYIQMWVATDDESPPEYRLAQAPPGEGAFALIAAADAAAPLRLRRRGARLLAARLRVGESAPLPVGAFVHVYVVEGSVRVGEHSLLAGDAARVTDADDASRVALTASADAGAVASADAGAEVLAWVMDAGPWRPPSG